MELRDKKVLVVGYERTGRALCPFLTARGARVTVTEKKTEAALSFDPRPDKQRGVRFETGGHKAGTFLSADLIIPSPGVPPISEIRAARKHGVPVISEIELAYRFLKGRIVGITGSNGKSTTTTLAHKILAEAGLPAFLTGNIGFPLISFVDRSRESHIYVTEISSFMLEYVEAFRPAVAAFLNVSQNHLDWHGSFEGYFETKKRLVLGLGAEGAAVLNRDDPLVWGLAEQTRAEVFAFSGKRGVTRGAGLEGGWVVLRNGAPRRVVPASRIPLPGAHNRDNVAAAAVIGRLFGVGPRRIGESVRTFRGLEHRLEEGLAVRGVRFVNDSKATTVDATLKALSSFDRPIVLILGGRDKGADFRPLRGPLRRRVRHVVLVGEAADKIDAAIHGAAPVERAGSFGGAVRLAAEKARRGDVVLLAPACTSWDMFRNFEERGRTFKREVRRLARRAEGLRRAER